MSRLSADILMITYNRPEYTRLALKRLLDAAGDNVRVWLWHNGDDEETLDVVRSMSSHPRVFQFHHSHENVRLRAPTNWMWASAKGDLFGKVDDDCLVPLGWCEALANAHADGPRLGVIGCWHFAPDDFHHKLASRKIEQVSTDCSILRNCWTGGSGYLMKRACYDELGPIREGQTFTDYCVRASLNGWVNGWHYPLLFQEHMDDPRAEHTQIKNDADLLRTMPLSAGTFGAKTVEEWTESLRRNARFVQIASHNPKRHIGRMARFWWLLYQLRAACY